MSSVTTFVGLSQADFGRPPLSLVHAHRTWRPHLVSVVVNSARTTRGERVLVDDRFRVCDEPVEIARLRRCHAWVCSDHECFPERGVFDTSGCCSPGAKATDETVRLFPNSWRNVYIRQLNPPGLEEGRALKAIRPAVVHNDCAAIRGHGLPVVAGQESMERHGNGEQDCDEQKSNRPLKRFKGWIVSHRADSLHPTLYCCIRRAHPIIPTVLGPVADVGAVSDDAETG